MNPAGAIVTFIGMALTTFSAYAWRRSLPLEDRPPILRMRRPRLSYGRYTKTFWFGFVLMAIGFSILAATGSFDNPPAN